MTRRAAGPPIPPVPPVPPAPPAGTTAWYGKLPARGDFVSQGFSAGHIRAWDGWLQGGLALASQRWAPIELDRRLRAFPVWRFLAWPAGAAGAPWAGVMLASHDRVGRAFPLTVGELLDVTNVPGLGWLDIEAALARMADVALDAIDAVDSHAVEDFEAILHSLGPVFAPARVAARAAMRVQTQPGAKPVRPQQSPLDLLRNSPGTGSLWWSEPTPGAAPLPMGDSWPPHAGLLLELLHQPGDPD